jgi:hypothetical protein
MVFAGGVWRILLSIVASLKDSACQVFFVAQVFSLLTTFLAFPVPEKKYSCTVSVHTPNSLNRLCAIMLVFLACVSVDNQVPERDRALFSGAGWQEHQGSAMKIAVRPD